MKNDDVTLVSTGHEQNLPEALQTPTEKKGIGFIIGLTVVNIGVIITMLPLLSIVLPIQLEEVDAANKVTWLGIIVGIGAIIGLIVNPVVGALSDRTASKIGRRRPWLLVGALMTCISFILLMNSHSGLAVLLSYLIWAVGFNFIMAAVAAIMPDQVPPKQRGTVAGITGLAMPVGAIIGSVVCGSMLKTTTYRYLFLSAVAFILIVPYALFILKDKPLAKEFLPPFKLGTFLKSFIFNPRKAPDFGWVWLARFVMFFGYSLVGNYLIYFLSDVVHFGQIFPGQTAAQGVAQLTIYNTVMMVIATVLGGILSDHFKRRKLFVILASIIMAVSLGVMGVLPLWGVIMVAYSLFGFGFGAYMAVDGALMTQCLPNASDRAKDMGIFNIANSLPQSLAPMLAAPVINMTHNYLLLYLSGAVIIILSTIFIQKVKNIR